MSSLIQAGHDIPKFSTQQLEQWKDEIAEWWGKEKLRYEHKTLVKRFEKWFGITEDDAIRVEFNSREDSEKIIEHILEATINDFKKKLHEKPISRFERISLSFQVGAKATVLFQNRTYNYDIDGHVALIGEVFYLDGKKQTLFQRFISHPFWQYSHITSKP